MQQAKIVSLSGFDLVIGGDVKVPGSDMFGGRPETKKIDPVLPATAGFIIGVIGLILSFVKGRGQAIGSAACGGVSVLCLLIVPSQLGSAQVAQQSMGMLQAEPEIGYYLAMLLFAAGAVCVAVGEFGGGTQAPAAAAPPAPPPETGTGAGSSG